jgi:hypothetical protein
LTDADPTTLAVIREYLLDGRIMTSVTGGAPGHSTTLAAIDNQLVQLRGWDGATINDGVNFSQVLIKHTWLGDTNLDGKVTEDDYLNVIDNQGQPGQWFTGDLNGDGLVTVDDLAVVSQNLGAGLAAMIGPQTGLVSHSTAPTTDAKTAVAKIRDNSATKAKTRHTGATSPALTNAVSSTTADYAYCIRMVRRKGRPGNPRRQHPKPG